MAGTPFQDGETVQVHGDHQLGLRRVKYVQRHAHHGQQNVAQAQFITSLCMTTCVCMQTPDELPHAICLHGVAPIGPGCAVKPVQATNNRHTVARMSDSRLPCILKPSVAKFVCRHVCITLVGTVCLWYDHATAKLWPLRTQVTPRAGAHTTTIMQGTGHHVRDVRLCGMSVKSTTRRHCFIGF